MSAFFDVPGLDRQLTEGPARILTEDVPKDLVRLRDVGVSYGSSEILAGIDLVVAPGDYVSVTGRSGAGKSTLLNLVAGTVFPTRGTVHVGGHDLSTRAGRASAQRSVIGYVFQSAHLVAWMSALDNVALGMRYQGVTRRERTTRARQALNVVGLGHRLDHRPAELSGGERQRVALARAIARRPALLLADEPTGNLDAHTGAHVVDLIEAVVGPAVAVLLITHDRQLAARGSRRWVVGDGAVHEEAPTSAHRAEGAIGAP